MASTESGLESNLDHPHESDQHAWDGGYPQSNVMPPAEQQLLQVTLAPADVSQLTGPHAMPISNWGEPMAHPGGSHHYPAMIAGPGTMETHMYNALPSSHQPFTTIQQERQHYGPQITSDDVIKGYRKAYWEGREWKASDTEIMEEVVKAVGEDFWDRVQRAVSISRHLNSEFY